MKSVSAALVMLLLGAAPALAQERDPSLKRIDLGLRQTLPLAVGPPPLDIPQPTTIGPFTFVQPVKRGEFVRISVPIGEWIMSGASGVSSANRRRKEAAVRRRVDADLKPFLAAQKPK